MNDNAEIRALLPKDITQLHSVIDDYQDDTGAFMNLLWNPDDFRRVLVDLVNDFGESDTPYCYGIFDDDDLCGVCTIMDDDNEESYIFSNLFVKKDRRNEGLGSNLVKTITSRFGCDRPVKLDFMTDNLGYFYRKCGFDVDMESGIATYMVERSISR